jgi:cell wall-associated NlpC family hydrolase
MNMTLVRFLGIPYTVNGEPPAACDCWTLVRWFCREELAMELPRFLYDAESITEDSAEQIAQETVRGLSEHWVKVDTPQRGDVMVMTMAGVSQHCGVYVDDGNFLHSLPGRDSTLERVSLWKNHIVGFYRWRP